MITLIFRIDTHAHPPNNMSVVTIVRPHAVTCSKAGKAMRVTAETKQATRDAILQSARRLFARQGFDSTTTRDIAKEAEIASGTLFNYFATKEAIVAGMVNQALGESQSVDDALQADTLEEGIFSLIALSLRKMKPFRKYLPALLTTSLSPLAGDADEDAASLRLTHLEAVARLAANHGCGEMSPAALQLYWALYIGVLVFWANDSSPKQEDTLALVDDSLNMYVDWLRKQSPGEVKLVR
jgi:AcrR family transcriptional regulator